MNNIKFCADMLPLILSGRKTQTRRLEKKGEVGETLFVKATPQDEPLGECAHQIIYIQITAVRQERLQEIPDYAYWREGYMRCEHDCSPYDWFVATWDSTYGDHPGCAWADNPLVWVHEFRVVEAAR